MSSHVSVSPGGEQRKHSTAAKGKISGRDTRRKHTASSCQLRHYAAGVDIEHAMKAPCVTCDSGDKVSHTSSSSGLKIVWVCDA